MRNEVKVMYHDILVGRLAETKNKLVAFEYDDKWILEGFSISPFSLPLKKQVFIPKNNLFNGLFGVFSDSLPDSWGRLLIQRKLEKEGIKDSSELFKLTLVGKLSMGALTYLPSNEFKATFKEELNYDELSLECQKILEDKESKDLDIIYNQGGSSGGARPKVNIKIGNDIYLMKFFTRIDGKHAGKMEYDYSLCAKECGIDMPDTQLLKSNICDGFFAVKRFDIKNNKKIHMISAASLLEYDFNAPSMDYNDLFKLTKILTTNNDYDCIQLFKRMCFNVHAHNFDDHGKNFSYLYDDKSKKWRLSPAYDMTFSQTYYGEHTTSINGKGKDITDEDLINVGLRAGLKEKLIKEEINAIKTKIHGELKHYL